VKLPVYLGKSVIDDVATKGEANCSWSSAIEAGKEYAWSRGLGIEHSSIKTKSARKKMTLDSSIVSVPQTSTEGGALRALKALARSK
jgi:hypothetical protein